MPGASTVGSRSSHRHNVASPPFGTSRTRENRAGLKLLAAQTRQTSPWTRDPLDHSPTLSLQRGVAIIQRPFSLRPDWVASQPARPLGRGQLTGKGIRRSAADRQPDWRGPQCLFLSSFLPGPIGLWRRGCLAF